MNAPSRTRLLGMGLLVTVFVAGGLAGAASTRVLSARETPPASADATCRDRGPHYIFEELDLSAGQRARIDTIMGRRRAAMDSVWQVHGQAIREAYEATRQEIGTVLTPAQRAEYDRLREHYQQERERREARADSAIQKK